MTTPLGSLSSSDQRVIQLQIPIFFLESPPMPRLSLPCCTRQDITYRCLSYPLSGMLSQGPDWGKGNWGRNQGRNNVRLFLEVYLIPTVPHKPYQFYILIDYTEGNRGKHLYTGFHPSPTDHRFAPQSMNSHIFLGFTNVITKCSQWHPNGPLSHRRPRMGGTNTRQSTVGSIQGEVSLSPFWQRMSASLSACTGLSIK